MPHLYLPYYIVFIYWSDGDFDIYFWVNIGQFLVTQIQCLGITKYRGNGSISMNTKNFHYHSLPYCRV